MTPSITPAPVNSPRRPSGTVGFKRASTGMAALAATLSLLLVAAPGVVLAMFGLPTEDPDGLGGFLARRAGLMFLGVAVLLWLARGLADAAGRAAISAGAAVLMGGLAVAGIVELARGYVGPGILLAVAAEVFFSVTFATLWRRARRAES